MYDSIDCHYSLPMPEDPKGYTGSYGFQTKDFDCGLDLYVIDKDGRLSIERRETEWIEGDPNGKSFLDKMGHVKTIKTWLAQLNFMIILLVIILIMIIGFSIKRPSFAAR